jgi:oxalate decarboxylase/phosphoglucose isomerase-like protein (cupin superfamily)
MFTEVTPPGGGPPPHFHDFEDEWFFPLDGRVEFFLNGQWTEAAPRSVVSAPRDVVHAVRSPGDQPLTMFIQTAPAGFEEFIRRCAVEFARPGGPETSRIASSSAEHGIHFVAGLVRPNRRNSY